MMYGKDYVPPQPSIALFSDVPLTAWYAKWVHAAYSDGLLLPCDTATLAMCPLETLDRAWAAYMMVHAKDMVIP
jgi:hypothetical protein